MSREIESAARKAGSVHEEVVWSQLAEWAVSDDVKHRCAHGPNWIAGRLYMKDATTGMVIGVIPGGVREWPPRADCESAGRILLDEAVAESNRLKRQTYILKLTRRAEDDGPDSLTLDELRELAREQGVDVDAVERRARALMTEQKKEQSIDTTAAESGPKES